ncbi:response regulator [Deinococcus soli (ex Cha et al. 2016)]|uniref:response regulator n=1 Tax=Deinococcus soli (ex Cha et al. 2016) TaxID=1309411 RepID=UPI00166C28E5|nr:response regulator [Deinococcus soli (ex Cha et al. 2016)]GGB68726.1 response regulator [Deinococcus soli (ex Cha et al. 2016)]
MTTHPLHVLRVLLVDDNPNDQLLALEAFADHDARVHVSVCNDGPEALSVLTSGRDLPDVVVLDLNMPVMSGFDVIREIRSAPALKHLPVVILSTSSDREDIRRAYDLLASAYLVKSASFPAFVEQIDRFVGFWHSCRFPGHADQTA